MLPLNENDFVDILAARRTSSDFAWASRAWSCPTCRYSRNRSPKEIQQQVLDSRRVNNVIKELSQQNGQSEDELRQKAMAILDEMSHNFQLRAIRFFGYVLSKLMKKLYENILVNKSGIEKVASVSSQYPILFLPTHRSYADFLVLSYVCFHFNLPVPVIAAGLDFLGLKTVSTLLRNSGAFFIRRSFIDDRLYWEVFSEYVKTHIQGCEFPIEFFIEGTRSRTAKSLVPKLGMLQVIMEEVLASKIPDIMVVPVSISYDRTLEEQLYAYELLGVPKPKESTKGLFKARKILSDNFGRMYVSFGDPISSKEFFKSYDRSIHNLHPREAIVMGKEEQLLCRDMANYVIHMHHSNLVLSMFPLMCLVIGHPFYLRCGDGAVHITELTDLVFWLKHLLEKMGASFLTGDLSPSKAIEYQISLHSNIVEVSEDSIVRVRRCENEFPVHRLGKQTVSRAVPFMFMYHYGNQALQLLIHVCMACLSMSKHKTSSNEIGNLFSRYVTLRRILQREFVFGRTTAEKDFGTALQMLSEMNAITIVDSRVFPVAENEEKIAFLSHLPLHFVTSYHVICCYLTKCTVAEDANSKSLSHQCQLAIEKSILIGDVQDYRCLSLDIINNFIALLVSEGALLKEKREKEIILTPKVSKIENLMLDIEHFLPASAEMSTRFDKISAASSKL